MKRTFLTATAVALSFMAVTASLPVRADQGDIDFKMIWEMADKDKNSMITKQEFLDAMGKAYDMKMAKMKSAKDADKMMKGDAMTREGFKSLINDLHHGS